MSELCRAEYEPGDVPAATVPDRHARCGLAGGHDGDHLDPVTQSAWPQTLVVTYSVIQTGVGSALARDTSEQRDVLWQADLRLFSADAWPVLVAVLTQPDEAVDHVAQAITDGIRPGWWSDMDQTHRAWYRQQARAVLAALRSLPDNTGEVSR